MRPAGASVTIALCGAAALGGCQSTQDKSAELAHQAKRITSVAGQNVTHSSANVKVLRTTLLHDSHGTAAVLQLRNVSARLMVKLPIEIQVADAHGQSLFKNTASGLEPSLTSLAALAPRAQSFWVDDQILGGGAPSSVKATVGDPPPQGTHAFPRLLISATKLTDDPTNGPEVIGSVANRSGIPQPKLTIYAVALRGNRVVAAGRGGVPLLAAGPRARPAHFQIFFIGDPRGAHIVLSAPPTALS